MELKIWFHIFTTCRFWRAIYFANALGFLISLYCFWNVGVVPSMKFVSGEIAANEFKVLFSFEDSERWIG